MEQEKELQEQFDNLKNDLSKWGSTVDDLLYNSILIDYKKEYKIKIPPSFRVKTTDSFIAKALYRGKNYSNPILDIEDKIGTRVVFLLSNDVRESATLIENYDGWVVKKTKDYDEFHKNKPEAFGYQSIHFVVSPKENDGSYENDTNLLTCEIQLRTLLQHAYSELSHDSTYKGPFKSDMEVQRRLSKSMALMEATDDYFCEVNNMIKDDSRKMRNFTNGLVSLYKELDSTFKDENLDKRVLEVFYDVYEKVNHSYDLELLEKHFHTPKNLTFLKYLVDKNQYYLVRQPTIILISFLINRHRDTLRTHWPLEYSILNTTLNSFNIATTN